jgi:hypothetical protein
MIPYFDILAESMLTSLCDMKPVFLRIALA